MTDQFYNPKDEGRLPWDDPSINYDWETQKK
jgi:dTDP-4-dehydrorhamnose 3,5-epimerase-like enzyme